MTSSSLTSDSSSSGGQPPQAVAGRWVWIVLIALVFLGWALRLQAVAPRIGKAPFTTMGDENSYVAKAIDVQSGEFKHVDRAPGYPLVLAGLFWLIDSESGAVILAGQTLLTALAIPLTFWVARRFVPPGLALVASGIVAIDHDLISQTARIYSEALYVLLILLACAAAVWMNRSATSPQTLGRGLLAGMALGLLTITRPVTLLFGPLALLFLPWHWPRKLRWQAAGLYLIGSLLPVVPITWMNWRNHGEFLPVSVSTAVLWQGSPEFYQLVNSGRRLSDIWKNELDPDLNGGHDPFSIEGDRYFSARAIQSIRAEPAVYAKYCVKKAWYFWFGNFFSDRPYDRLFNWLELRRDMKLSPARAIGFIAVRQLPWLGLIAGALLIARRKVQGHLFSIVLMVYLTLMHAMTYAGIRFSIPLHPLLAILIVSAAEALWQRTRPTAPAECTMEARPSIT